MNSKKAISPLIATILLVVVAVVLVTIVLSWSKTFSNESLDTVSDIVDNSCTDMIGSLNISDCQILSDGNVTFFLTNSSNDYTYPDGDGVLKINLTDGVGNIDSQVDVNSSLNHITAGWGSFGPGEVESIKIDVDSVEDSNPIYVEVKSVACPSDAYATAVCRE
jgi:flagellin-like protein